MEDVGVGLSSPAVSLGCMPQLGRYLQVNSPREPSSCRLDPLAALKAPPLTIVGQESIPEHSVLVFPKWIVITGSLDWAKGSSANDLLEGHLRCG